MTLSLLSTLGKMYDALERLLSPNWPGSIWEPLEQWGDTALERRTKDSVYKVFQKQKEQRFVHLCITCYHDSGILIWGNPCNT